MGDYLVEKNKETISTGDVDVVMPISILLDLPLCSCKTVAVWNIEGFLKIDTLVEHS